MRMIVFSTVFILFMSSCSQRLVYTQYSNYAFHEEEQDCRPVRHDHKDKLIINTKAGYVKAFIFGENKKLKIESYEYQYRFMSLFRQKKDRKSIRIECENGYSLYAEYNRFAILSIPDDGDDDECDDTIFYDLISK